MRRDTTKKARLNRAAEEDVDGCGDVSTRERDDLINCIFMYQPTFKPRPGADLLFVELCAIYIYVRLSRTLSSLPCDAESFLSSPPPPSPFRFVLTLK